MYQCPNCKGKFKKKIRYVKGSLLIELFLWCCFVIPGLIYSLWRQCSYHSGCPYCGWTHVAKITEMPEQGYQINLVIDKKVHRNETK